MTPRTGSASARVGVCTGGEGQLLFQNIGHNVAGGFGESETTRHGGLASSGGCGLQNLSREDLLLFSLNKIDLEIQ